MREGRPWLWQADAYGAAATLHTLLFGQYMEVERVRDSSTGEREPGGMGKAGLDGEERPTCPRAWHQRSGAGWRYAAVEQ